jgi:hypothetical protein
MCRCYILNQLNLIIYIYKYCIIFKKVKQNKINKIYNI